MTRRKSSIHPRFNLGGPEIMGGPHRPSVDYLSHRLYSQLPIKKPVDDEDSQPRTSSISSATAPVIQPPPMDQKLTASHDTSANVKIDLSPPLSEMSVIDICDCLKNDISGLKSTMISSYIQDINEYNISGRVLATCELDELKQVFSMTFGDWVLFSNWVQTKREEERCSRFHLQSQPAPTVNSSANQNQSVNDPFNDYQFYSEKSVLGSALNRLMSPTVPKATTNSVDEVRTNAGGGAAGNEGVSIVSAPKNVKFLIPLGRSGITSNESTFGVIESTTRTITHVKDIFPFNPSSATQATSSNGGHIVTATSSSDSEPTAPVFDVGRREDQNEIVQSNGEEMPLLPDDNSNQK